MSQQNVEIVRTSIKRFAASQQPSGLTASDLVWDMREFRGWPDKDQYFGLDGVLEFLRTWIGTYEEWTMRPEAVHDAGGDRVVAIIRQRGRLHGAGSWVEGLYGAVYTLQDEQIKRIQWYATPQDALKATGLDG